MMISTPKQTRHLLPVFMIGHPRLDGCHARLSRGLDKDESAGSGVVDLPAQAQGARRTKQKLKV
jgi:hypothetical protein